MNIDIKRATSQDAPAIAGIMRTIWAEESIVTKTVEQALEAADHVTYLALAADATVGFVDGFTTRSADGVLRWEIDLVAVLPTWRGQQIGRRLIAASLAAGGTCGAAVTRALVHVDNRASQHAFASNGFHVVTDSHLLVVASDSAPAATDISAELYCVPVTTCRYRGIWLERPLDTEGYRAARALQLRDGYEIAGAITPQHIAVGSGWVIIGRYDWWVK